MIRNFIVLGLISGVVGGFIMLLISHLPGNSMHPYVATSLVILIPLLSLIVPQYFFYYNHSNARLIQLFMTGWIAIIVWISTISFIGPFLNSGISINPELAATTIGVSSVVSFITAFLMGFIKKRKIPSSESLDDMDC